jgi:hypothetical protein
MLENKEVKEDNLNNNKIQSKLKIESNGKDQKEADNNVHLITNETMIDLNIITDQLQDSKIDHSDNKEIKEEIMPTEINIVIKINSHIEVEMKIIEGKMRIRQSNIEEEVRINNSNIEEEVKINITAKDKISEMNLMNKIQK